MCGERLCMLTGVVVLGHVRVVVVLAREAVGRVDRAADRECGHDAELHRATIDERERAGHALADRAGGGVGCGAEHRPAAAEHLGVGRELSVDLEADDGLVFIHRARWWMTSACGLASSGLWPSSGLPRSR